jgi:hypothetical protein
MRLAGSSGTRGAGRSLANAGRSAIMSSVIGNFVGGGPLGGVSGLLTAGMLEEVGREALSNLNPAGGSPDGPVGTLLDLLKQSAELSEVEVRSGGRSQRSGGSFRDKVSSAVQKRRNRKAHEKWLADNSWRFDWRSQPRRPAGTPEGGEWMEGRLDHPVAVKYHLSRRVRQQRSKALKAYKARRAEMGDTRTRTIRTSWGDY